MTSVPSLHLMFDELDVRLSLETLTKILRLRRDETHGSEHCEIFLDAYCRSLRKWRYIDKFMISIRYTMIGPALRCFYSFVSAPV